MKAAVLEQAREPLAVQEVPDPRPGPTDVLIRVHASGVCHTDLHIVDGMFEAFGLPLPPILGHEAVGVVEEVGDMVTHLHPSDRVGVSYIFSCEHCRYCVAGEEELCPERRMAGMD